MNTFTLPHRNFESAKFKFVQILSLRAYEEGSMPILQFLLEIVLTLCAPAYRHGPWTPNEAFFTTQCNQKKKKMRSIVRGFK